MIKFNKYNVVDTVSKIKARVFYSVDNRTDGRKVVTIYAKDYDRKLGEIMPNAYENNTEIMTDYFEKGTVRLFEDHPLYKAARARAAPEEKVSTYYSQPIEMPKTKRDGLANFVQIIINKIEAGQSREALLSAVDLLDDIVCGNYDDAMSDAKGHSAIIREMEAKHMTEIIEAGQSGQNNGIALEKARMAAALGLA